MYVYMYVFIVCLHAYMHIRKHAPVEVRGQILGAGLLPQCGFWGSNSGPQAWQQAPLPAEPAHHPPVFLFLFPFLQGSLNLEGVVLISYLGLSIQQSLISANESLQ